jgi:hypothetical protein
MDTSTEVATGGEMVDIDAPAQEASTFAVMTAAMLA